MNSIADVYIYNNKTLMTKYCKRAINIKRFILNKILPLSAK